MPLLKKKKFVKAPLPDHLRDDEEIFHCSITDEVFRDYEEFSERMFLCNSMVWTCSMTGKTNLTYTEALDSEENAVKSLKEFPEALKVPILYLASKTRRATFKEMADDVFNYVKDRYFKKENVETCFTGNKWKDSHILQAIAPREEQLKKSPKNGTTDKNSLIPASLYKYEIEHLDAYDSDISEIMIADPNQIRRHKNFTRDRSKLFLKQHVEQDDEGYFVIKQSAMDSYRLNDLTFGKIFDGPPPQFEVSKKQRPKKVEKPANGHKKSNSSTPNGHQKKTQKKQKQESLHKFLTKTDGSSSAKNAAGENVNNANLLERMRKKEEEFKLMQQQKKEEKLALKQKLRDENLILTKKMKSWYKPKEDLELIDQKKLPAPVPVCTKVPDEHTGDMLMVIEFVHSFATLLQLKSFFPNGLTLELMERALTEVEVAGPFIDVIQMLLNALFAAQEEEMKEYKVSVDKTGTENKQESKDKMHEAIRQATRAAGWSHKHHGLPINQLPLYPLTTSEILRLHLLSSGAKIYHVGASWRYQERGGYTSEDDPGLHFKINHPHIFKALEVKSVNELPIGDKLKIVSCLIDQLMTYANVRDVIEERVEKIRHAKVDLQKMLAIEKKREQEFATARFKMNREGKDNPNLQQDLALLEEETNNKKKDNLKGLKKYTKASKPVLMGQDRAFRRYHLLESVPGFFVSNEEENPGQCLSSIVKQNPDLVGADRNAILAHLRKNLEDTNSGSPSSDKENNPSRDSSPSKKLNGARTSGGGVSLPSLPQDKAQCDELLMCSADPSSCVIHSEKRPAKFATKWSFYYKMEVIDDLIGSLNKRGHREGELQQNLDSHRYALEAIVDKIPLEQLNPKIAAEENPDILEEKEERTRKSSSRKSKYEDANLGFSGDTDHSEILHNLLVENILELEEKVFAGDLGKLLIDDREKWRSDLQNKNYKDFDRTLNKREKNNPGAGSKDNDNTSPESNQDIVKIEEVVKMEVDDDEEDQSAKTIRESIKCLSIALVQVARSVYQKYLKKPLGTGFVNQQNKLLRERLDQWEVSCLEATSFSQLFLHYFTLDSCVMWSRSVLLAKCRICRKSHDSDQMLLCDTCNLGYHTFCLRPKLRSIPKGDWHCLKCTNQKKKEEEAMMVVNPPAPLRKRKQFRDDDDQDESEVVTLRKRRIFREDDDQDESEEVAQEEEEESDAGAEEADAAEEEEEADAEEEENDEEEEEVDGEEEEVADEEEPAVIKVELCKTCGSGGELICCEECSTSFHIECVEPPLRRAPRGAWVCTSCKRPAAENGKKRQHPEYSNGTVCTDTGVVMNGQRRCAAKALYKIHNFAKSLRNFSESEEDSGEEEVINKRPNRREDARNDLPLHNSALHEVLAEIMKDTNAWPFLRPVQKNEVPDYYDVITKPMDFGTIKYKLNMGEYHEDSQFMADAVLIFQNCNTYNHTDDDVFKCGVELLKHFQKKCRELGLRLPEEMECDDEESLQQRKKKRLQ